MLTLGSLFRWYLFDLLNNEFGFTCDVCADEINRKCDLYFDRKADGLSYAWYGVCWCNPPYGRDIAKWVEKAHLSALCGVTTVMLLPARTDTKYFHEYIYGRYEVRFLRGRLKFVRMDKIKGVCLA